MNVVPLHRLHVDRPGIAWQVAIELHDCFRPGKKLYVLPHAGRPRRAFFVSSDTINNRTRLIYQIRGSLKVIIWLE